MKIAAIGTTSPVSRGYLDKSVYRYINTSASNTKRSIGNIAGKMPKGQIEAALTKLENTRQETINNLESFIGKCHPKTYMAMEYNDVSGIPCLVINNKKAALKNGIPGVALLLSGENTAVNLIPPVRENISHYSGNLSAMLSDADLKQLNKYSEELIKVAPETTDKTIYRNYRYQVDKNSNSPLRFFTHRKGLKVCREFAKEIGLIKS